MRIEITTPKGIIHGVLNDSKAALTFASLLPLKVSFSDLFGREKYGKLPNGLSLSGARIFQYEKSQIAYWSPGNDLVLFYHHDGAAIPAPGLIALGSITKGLSIIKDLDASFPAAISIKE
jgi:hypothetical protein